MVSTVKIADGLQFDMATFKGQRALFQGASNSGKSNGARLLLESTYGQFQHIVIDIEDEFHTLRTADRQYAIIGGDHADVPLALTADFGDLAQTLLRIGMSTILQIGDWKLEEKRNFVGQFIAGMMRTKSDLWHPTIVMLDETHLFVPEGKVTAASEAVTHLATAGRKRGFGAIFATQRLSLISKDVVGQCENKFIGRVQQTADRAAAADLLGFTAKSPEAIAMQSFLVGEFFTVGPAISFTPEQHRLLKAQTEAPQPGYDVAPSPSSKEMRAAFAELAKAGQTAETKPEPNAPLASDAGISEEYMTRMVTDAFERGTANGYKSGRADSGRLLLKLVQEFVLENDSAEAPTPRESVKPEMSENGGMIVPPAIAVAVKKELAVPAPVKDDSPAASSITTKLTKSLMRALEAVHWWHEIGFETVDRKQAAVVAGLSPTASTFGVYVSDLIKRGLLVHAGEGKIALSPDGAHLMNGIYKHVNVGSAFDSAIALLKPRPAAVLGFLASKYPAAVSRQDIADHLGLSYVASTTGVYIAEVTRYGFTEPAGRGMVRAAEWLFHKRL